MKCTWLLRRLRVRLTTLVLIAICSALFVGVNAVPLIKCAPDMNIRGKSCPDGVIRSEVEWGERLHYYYGFPFVWKYDHDVQFFNNPAIYEMGKSRFYPTALVANGSMAIALIGLAAFLAEVVDRKWSIKNRMCKWVRFGIFPLFMAFGGILITYCTVVLWERSHSGVNIPGSLQHRIQFHHAQEKFQRLICQFSLSLTVSDVNQIFKPIFREAIGGPNGFEAFCIAKEFFIKVVGGPPGFETFACAMPYSLAVKDDRILAVIYHDYPCWRSEQATSPRCDWDRPFFDRHPEYLSSRYECILKDGIYTFELKGNAVVSDEGNDRCLGPANCDSIVGLKE